MGDDELFTYMSGRVSFRLPTTTPDELAMRHRAEAEAVVQRVLTAAAFRVIEDLSGALPDLKFELED